jgi:tight adherence protein B
MVFALAILAGTAAVGALVVGSAWSPARPRRRAERRAVARWVRPSVAALVAGAIGLAATGWLVGAVAAAAGGIVAWRWWERRGTGRHREQARIEALASWCEQLRDLLSAEHGILGTIGATVATCPEPIRPEVAALAAHLGRRSPDAAIGRFASDVDDPAGDLVASVLRLAMSRSSRTSELLSELATTIRERAAMRLRVEADRAGHRSEARFVIVFSALVVVGVLVFGRGSSFLDAYDTVDGQLALTVVVGLFATGGWWLARLTRFERPARFLAVGDEVADR